MFKYGGSQTKYIPTKIEKKTNVALFILFTMSNISAKLSLGVLPYLLIENSIICHRYYCKFFCRNISLAKFLCLQPNPNTDFRKVNKYKMFKFKML